MKRKVILMFIRTICVMCTILVTSTSILAKETPVPGGILKVVMTRPATEFGYPPKIASRDRNFAPPFFDRLLTIAEHGVYKAELATSWNTSADGKSITFKLRRGVKFHDGTDFNAQAVKSNFAALLPPNPVIIDGITSVDVVDPYTVRVNLSGFNNLILYQIASNFECYMYSPTALQKNGVDWATTHPVGTGPFKLESWERTGRMKMVRNPDYWEKGLPYLDGIEIDAVAEGLTQMASFKAGKVHAIYDAIHSIAAQLRDAGYPVLIAPGSLYSLSFDIKNNKILADKRVRQAIEYALDKEGICSGPGLNIYKPVYQIVPETSSAYNKACPPRKYDPAKAKQLLAEAGYPNGFTFKAFLQDSTWRDGLTAVQANLASIGIKMDINYVSTAVINDIILKGKLEPGATCQMGTAVYSYALFPIDYFWRSDALEYPFVVKPPGIDDLIDKAKSAREDASMIRTTQDIVKRLYDDETVVPLWVTPRIAVVDKSVQNAGYFINGDQLNNKFGRSTWLKK